MGQQPNTSLQSNTSIEENLQSLQSILGDIFLKLNHQVLANIEVLKNEHPEIRQNINVLLSSPIKQITGRLNGLNRVIQQIKSQVSSGN